MSTSADNSVREDSPRRRTVKKNHKKLTLHRDTLHQLSASMLREAGGGNKGTLAGCSVQVSCNGTCNGSCLTCTCPTFCGQWYC